MPVRSLLARNGMLSALQIVAATGGMFLVYRDVSVLLGLAALGAWSICLSIATPIAFFDLGASDAVVRQVASRIATGNKIASLHVVRTALAICTVGGLVGAAILALPVWLLASHFTSVPQMQLPGLVLGAFAVVFLNTLGFACTGALEGLERYDLKLAVSLVSVAVLVLSSQYLIPRFAIYGLVIAFVLQSASNFVLSFGIASRALNVGSNLVPPPSLATAQELVSVGFPIKAFGFVNLIIEPLTRLLIGHFGTLHLVGVYEVASRIVVQLRLLVVSATQAALPRMMKAASSGVSASRAVHAFTVRANAWGCITAFSLLALSLPWLLRLVTGRNDHETIVFGLVLLLGWLTNALSAPFFFRNVATLKVRRIWISAFIIAGVNLFAGLTLGAVFDAVGVVIALSLGVALGSVYTMCSDSSQLPVYGWSEIFLAILGVCAAIAFYLLPVADTPIEMLSAGRSILWSGAFLIVALIVSIDILRSSWRLSGDC
jgi:O-antigen/teichoic acid export membrane protein